MDSGGQKKRNRQMRWAVRPWVNVCRVVEGWIDGWTDARIDRKQGCEGEIRGRPNCL